MLVLLETSSQLILISIINSMSNEFIKNEAEAESVIAARNAAKCSVISSADTSLSSVAESPNEAVERLQSLCFSNRTLYELVDEDSNF